MRVVRFGFDINPAIFLAKYITENGFNPLKTILIVPTQRFRNHFSKSFLDSQSRDVLFAPTIVTPLQMITELSEMSGSSIANRCRCYSMFKRAVKKTEGVELLFNPECIDKFPDFVEVCEGYLSIFREINEQKIDFFSDRLKDLSVSIYGGLKEQFEIFKKLYKNYLEEQVDFFDPGFAINLIEEKHIIEYFKNFDDVILVNPVALTRFERWVYSVVNGELHVLYQDTPSFDFSRILAYRLDSALSNYAPRVNIYFSEEPTKTKQALAIIDVVYKLLEEGKKPEDILILNIDSDFSELLYIYLRNSGVGINFSEGMPLRDTTIYRFLSLIKRFYDSSLDWKVLAQLLKNDISREILEKTTPMEKLQPLDQTFNTDKNRSKSELSHFLQIIDAIYNSRGFDPLYRSINTVFGMLDKSRTREFYSSREVVLDKAFSLRELDVVFKETPFEILLHVLRNERFPLISENMKGIQILGLLETRGLSFPCIFVPSFNEGIMPRVVQKVKFFCSTFRRAIGLVPSQDREILQFYHLKRLIDGSKVCYLFSIKDKNGNYDTTSRFYYFIAQTAKRFRPLNSGYLVPHKPLAKKSEEKAGDISKIDLPPGGLNTEEISRYDIQLLKDCRTKYYIARILEIEEEDLSVRGLDHSLLGSIVHGIMNSIYRDFKFPIASERELASKIEYLIDERFHGGVFNTGEEIITREILKKKLGKVIQNDIKRFKKGWNIVTDFLEKELISELVIDGKTYYLKGILDRVDLSPGGEYHIIDYKTGNPPGKALHKPENGFKEVQLGFYGLIFNRIYPERKIGGLYYYDLLGDGEMVEVINGENMERYLELFLEHIICFIKEVDSSGYFYLAENPEKCSYCSFHQICRVLEVD